MGQRDVDHHPGDRVDGRGTRLAAARDAAVRAGRDASGLARAQVYQVDGRRIQRTATRIIASHASAGQQLPGADQPAGHAGHDVSGLRPPRGQRPLDHLRDRARADRQQLVGVHVGDHRVHPLRPRRRTATARRVVSPSVPDTVVAELGGDQARLEQRRPATPNGATSNRSASDKRLHRMLGRVVVPAVGEGQPATHRADVHDPAATGRTHRR